MVGLKEMKGFGETGFGGRPHLGGFGTPKSISFLESLF